LPIKIAVCDDSEKDAALLSDALLSYDPLFEVITFPGGQALLDELSEGRFVPDLVFLDIYMPGLDGIETARKIRSFSNDVRLIILSSSRDHYPQAYEVFAFNYLVKPFDRKRLYAILDRAIDELRKENDHKIRIQYKGAIHTIDCRQILYVESRNKLLLFYLKDGRKLQRYGKLEEILQQLPGQYFLRCHQSFVVNLFHVTEFGDNYFRIGHAIISISRKYGREAKERYYACLFSQMGGQTV